MRRLARGFLKLVIGVAVTVAVLAGALDYAFHRVYPLRPHMTAAVSARIQAEHIHPLTYDQIPALYREAVVSTEDRRFAWDPGFDPIGLARSILVDVEQDGYVEGGSTITEQLVDNTLLNQSKTLIRKVKQFVLALGVYDTFTKPETFAMYANVIYFGHGAYGLYNAAETYFGRPPGALNAGELTMLAGLPNAPSLYDPFRSLKLARERQRVVVDNMVDNGVISQEEGQAILQEPIRLIHKG
ncbi:MAG: transglycosylase domain-containing protein [Alicyclobacillus sp.]|nr:transglycosylase domain-containing protein [Alicyclobacillus sp.]